MTFEAVLGFDDPENDIPATRTIARGKNLDQVHDAALRIYETLLLDGMGVGRMVASRNEVKLMIENLQAFRIGIYAEDADGKRTLVLKVGGEL